MKPALAMWHGSNPHVSSTGIRLVHSMFGVNMFGREHVTITAVASRVFKHLELCAPELVGFSKNSLGSKLPMFHHHDPIVTVVLFHFVHTDWTTKDLRFDYCEMRPENLSPSLSRPLRWQSAASKSSSDWGYECQTWGSQMVLTGRSWRYVRASPVIMGFNRPQREQALKTDDSLLTYHCAMIFLMPVVAFSCVFHIFPHSPLGSKQDLTASYNKTVWIHMSIHGNANPMANSYLDHSMLAAGRFLSNMS